LTYESKLVVLKIQATDFNQKPSELFSMEKSMSGNDLVLLNELLKIDQKNKGLEDLSEPDFFGLFSAEQCLKGYDSISYDDIRAGCVDGGMDGGIDFMYTIVNGEVVQEQEDFDPSSYKKGQNNSIELIIIQAKTSKKFSEEALNKLIATSEEIFNFENDLAKLTNTYNPSLIQAAEIFCKVYKSLLPVFPAVRLRFFYATKGDQVSTGIKKKAEKLKSKILKQFSSAECEVIFLTAEELLKKARLQQTKNYSLKFKELFSCAWEKAIGYTGLVSLVEFNRFISIEGKLNRNIFESNVRDYQGSTEVNNEIEQSLRGNKDDDFWWLNNGITIISERIQQTSKELMLEDPQIVNGLQTSNEIFKYFQNLGPYREKTEDPRNVLIRAIALPSDQASRDRIIKSTNSQTAIPTASLRATEKIHRDIEEYLKPRGYFYERRKNFYKNENKKPYNIISIPMMAQSVMSILLCRPNDARARPSSLLKKDENYKAVFSDSIPISIYYLAPVIVKRIDLFLRDKIHLNNTETNNLKFYIAMRAIIKTSGGDISNHKKYMEKLNSNRLDDITDPAIENCFEEVKSIYDNLCANDKTAKGKDLVEKVKHLPL
jgi:hypothetical protein